MTIIPFHNNSNTRHAFSSCNNLKKAAKLTYHARFLSLRFSQQLVRFGVGSDECKELPVGVDLIEGATVSVRLCAGGNV